MSDIRKAVTISDLRHMARRRLPEFAFIPMETGGGDGSGAERNVRAFRERHLGARALVDVAHIDQEVTLFGRTWSSPFGISATGGAGILRRHADESLAEAAAAANIPFMLSGGSTASVETIARIAPGNVWQQLYVARDPKITDHIVGRARDAGVDVLVYTVDIPVRAKNDWLARSGIALPATVRTSAWPYVAWQALTHPAWTLEHLARGGLPRQESWAPYAPRGSSAAAIMKLLLSQILGGQTWSQVEQLRRLWPGRLVVKGLVDGEDARRALDLGADAVIVSTHGGHKLECMAAAVDYLPGVAGAVGDCGPVLFDGGIRRGSDILVSRALGAQFCFVGRATLYGVIAGGRKGAERAIDILREEIACTMALIGCPSLEEMGPRFLHGGDSAIFARKRGA